MIRDSVKITIWEGQHDSAPAYNDFFFIFLNTMYCYATADSLVKG